MSADRDHPMSAFTSSTTGRLAVLPSCRLAVFRSEEKLLQ
jgi:hypothetical protein